MGSQHIKITDSSVVDRISDLPSSIIDCILDRLPIRDAVATSVLSKEWRHKWRTVGNLVFDYEFVRTVISSRTHGSLSKMKFEYSNIIGKVLLLHLGPIRKFLIYIPQLGDRLSLELLSSWMLFLSQNGVKDLTISAPHTEIRLPSYIFHCNELQHLKVVGKTLDLHPPQDFGGFENLLSLTITSDSMDVTQIGNLILKCPLLERLSIIRMSGTQTLVIDAPRLFSLRAMCSMYTCLNLKNVQSLTTITLFCGVIKFCDLSYLFGSLPYIVNVTLRFLLLINDMPQDAPACLPITLHNHKSLTLLNIDISSHRCIYFVLYICKSSPNLQNLNLQISRVSYPDPEEEAAALPFLDMQIRAPPTLNSLATIKIERIRGREVEIMFIKLILSCSPALETMYFSRLDIASREAEISLMSELLKCKRASPQAQVIFSRTSQ